MKIQYLKFVKKWVVIYKGRARGAGNTPAEALDQVFSLILAKVI
jgi:hypothetical protein